MNSLQPRLSGYLRRYLLLSCGLVIMAFGVALSIIANMGISPISCLPYVLSQINTTFTVGQLTAAMHIVFVLLQILILRRQYEPYQLFQLIIGVALGMLIDFAMLMLSFLHPATYLEQCVLFLMSIIVVGFGMFLEVKASVLMVAGEGLVKAISQVSRIEFSKIKIASDCLLVVISLAIGIAFMHHVIGVREGTIIAAVLVGAVIKLLEGHTRFVDKFLSLPQKEIS